MTRKYLFQDSGFRDFIIHQRFIFVKTKKDYMRKQKIQRNNMLFLGKVWYVGTVSEKQLDERIKRLVHPQ